MNKITCFLPLGDEEQARQTVGALRLCPQVEKIYLLAAGEAGNVPEGCSLLFTGDMGATETWRRIALLSRSEFTLVCTGPLIFVPGLFALERMTGVAGDSGAGMVYADHYRWHAGKREDCPAIDYQEGSLRDDFDFGPVLLYRTDHFRAAVDAMKTGYRFAALYDLRLKVSQTAPLVHINEYLYTVVEPGNTLQADRQFGYVDPKNREVQLELEAVCTAHLKAVGGYLKPGFMPVGFDGERFEYEATVVIPVKNRVRTIGDAIRSVLSQETNFRFNLIVVDNYSTDGTTEAIDCFAGDERVIRVIPGRDDLGIGGCWNLAAHHPACGKFAVQLDSDDVYKDEHTLQKIVDAFYEQRCGMVVGSYLITDFEMNPLPPGVIDHREWTPENGRNNALRINGLGAPRAFYTPLLRRIKLPDTSYGEDYALGLRISREYPVGRIYEVLYLCRRWEGNSDASPDTEKLNRNNLYKDRIRTWELQARIRMNR